MDSYDKAIEYFPASSLPYALRADVNQKLGRDKEAAIDYIKFLELERESPILQHNSIEPLDIIKTGVKFAGMSDASDVIDLLEITKQQIDAFRYNMLLSKAQAGIIGFGIPRLLDELIENYSPDEKYEDYSFYKLALAWLEINNPEKKHYIGFIQLLLNNLEMALVEINEAIIVQRNSFLNYLRGVICLKIVRKIQNNEVDEKYSQNASKDFMLFLQDHPKSSVCPTCGHKENLRLAFCRICGSKMLTEPILE